MKSMIPVCALTILSCALLSAEPSNLITNCDFKKFNDSTGRPDDWNGSKIEVVEEGRNGATVMRLTSDYKNRENWKGSAYVILMVLTPGDYQLSFEVKGNASAVYAVLVFDKSLKTHKLSSKWFAVPNNLKPLSDGWMRGECILKVADNTKDGALIFEMFHLRKGDFEYLGNVSLTKMP